MKEKLILPADRDGVLWIYSASGETQRMHHHEELEFNLVIRGNGSYLVEDRQYDLTTNSFIWLFPAQEHVLLNESPDFSMWILLMKPEILLRFCASPENEILVDKNPSGSFYKILREMEASKLRAFLADVETNKQEQDYYNAGLGFAVMLAWKIFQGTPDGSGNFNRVHPAVELAVRIMREEVNPLSVEQIAKQAGLSASRLSYLFKAQTGVELVNFRNRQRLERFLDLYAAGHMSMLDAALEAGFGSYPQFHRVFKKLMGYGPAEYRRMLKPPE